MIINPNPIPVFGNTPPFIVVSFTVLFVPTVFVVLVVLFFIVFTTVLFVVVVFLSDVLSTTVTVHEAFFLPSCEVTVIIVEPIFLGVTFPTLSTVATVSSLEVHVTILFVVFSGLNVGFSVNVFPISTSCVFGNVILSSAISFSKLSTNIQPYIGFILLPEK